MLVFFFWCHLASIFHVCSPLLEMHAAGHPHPIHHPPQDVSFLCFSLCVFIFFILLLYFFLIVHTNLPVGRWGVLVGGVGGNVVSPSLFFFYYDLFVCFTVLFVVVVVVSIF